MRSLPKSIKETCWLTRAESPSQQPASTCSKSSWYVLQKALALSCIAPSEHSTQKPSSAAPCECSFPHVCLPDFSADLWPASVCSTQRRPAFSGPPLRAPTLPPVEPVGGPAFLPQTRPLLRPLLPLSVTGVHHLGIRGTLRMVGTWGPLLWVWAWVAAGVQGRSK
eukprot:78531-Pelagomonas_calceolata.AAC.1